MTRQNVKRPERNVREVAHELALKLAIEGLGAVIDIAGQCRKSGAQYISGGKNAIINYLNKPYQIGFPGGEVSLAESGEAVPLRDKILILHYFIRASGTALTGRMITYQELREGINYYPTFFKRAVEPIVNRYKDEPGKLLEAGQRLGGVKAAYGDAAVTIPALPRVPLTVVLRQGDTEFAPDGNILFDSTITDYLPTEDITILCEVLAWRLARL
jgi:hypothetical protein